jgi:hypothetical protein
LRSRSAPVDNPNIALDANECLRQRSSRFALVVRLRDLRSRRPDRLEKLGRAGISEKRKQRTGSKDPFAAPKLDQRNSVRVSTDIRRATSRNGGGFVAKNPRGGDWCDDQRQTIRLQS